MSEGLALGFRRDLFLQGLANRFEELQELFNTLEKDGECTRHAALFMAVLKEQALLQYSMRAQSAPEAQGLGETNGS